MRRPEVATTILIDGSAIELLGKNKDKQSRWLNKEPRQPSLEQLIEWMADVSIYSKKNCPYYCGYRYHQLVKWDSIILHSNKIMNLLISRANSLVFLYEISSCYSCITTWDRCEDV
jgi:hypothetical protein